MRSKTWGLLILSQVKTVAGLLAKDGPSTVRTVSDCARGSQQSGLFRTVRGDPNSQDCSRLEPIDPLVFFAAIHSKVREEGRTVAQLRINRQVKDILGIWLGEQESRKFKS